MWVVEAVGVGLFAAALVLGLLVLRRIRLLRRAGGIDVALRTRLEDSPRGWHLGVGHYRGDDFLWFRVLSLRSGPDQVVQRTGLEISSRRAPSAPEAYAMPVGSTVLRCAGNEREIELAMTQDALTGFLSWLESAPPGHSVPWAS
ncbi:MULTISPECIES: DUF2550 domain-containing protein [Actinoalloteichus]|uniref:DUF2550 family protein n=1 Tax=Actinoalloteichus fjordicus TaxID=1612552 RepID=A0AAC9L9L6_9PSEU|nr:MULTISPECIES: DUF2550 domain-containing protein [Actinoalloteichus]APU13486.1 putative DUF2550 family protein [Actinoalloteichus fjordicus]APU19435.1 putative DUF2550 family protein [Actinoalloteichus sp. GBA129-24]